MVARSRCLLTGLRCLLPSHLQLPLVGYCRAHGLDLWCFLHGLWVLLLMAVRMRVRWSQIGMICLAFFFLAAIEKCISVPGGS